MITEQDKRQIRVNSHDYAEMQHDLEVFETTVNALAAENNTLRSDLAAARHTIEEQDKRNSTGSRRIKKHLRTRNPSGAPQR